MKENDSLVEDNTFIDLFEILNLKNGLAPEDIRSKANSEIPTFRGMCFYQLVNLEASQRSSVT